MREPDEGARLQGAEGLTAATIRLRGPGGEPVDLRRTFVSHGVASLPPLSVDEHEPSMTATVTAGRSVRTVRIQPAARGSASVSVLGRREEPSPAVLEAVRRIMRMDEDLSDFYEMTSKDPDLSWVGLGAGRMIRSQTVFEEVVKTVCTTNCTWSATERMVGALVEHLGRKAPGAPAGGPGGRAFPTPAVMADADESFYRDVVRAGYRGTYLRSLADSVASGHVDLQELESDHPAGMDDDEVEQRLLALPGVGPYAAAHVMMMLGRYSRLILDSWTRPKYARVLGRKAVADRSIERRFRPFGRYAGLAFWMFITRDWVDD